MHTPWGEADHVEHVAPGVMQVSTPSHGGLYVDHIRNQKIPAALRRDDGWYEEDCDWAIPVTFLPGLMDERKERALESLKRWHPVQYALHYGVKLPEKERP